MAKKTKPIPEDQWIWGGHAAHLCVRSDCLFHLATMVGRFTISTVGDYRPPQRDRLSAKPVPIGAGADALYETYVFEGRLADDGCPDIKDGNEIDSKRYATASQANRGHIEMCRKYARLAHA